MDTSASHSILLKTRKMRCLRKQFLLFLDLLGLYVSVGYDLFYAWNEAVESSNLFTKPRPDESMNNILKGLEANFSLRGYRFMFSVLRQLYSQGATLSPAIAAFAKTLRRDLERDIEGHLRTAPTLANICLLFFFLPPALGLVVFPFLQHLRELIFSP